jgi:hypothetical protein
MVGVVLLGKLETDTFTAQISPFTFRVTFQAVVCCPTKLRAASITSDWLTLLFSFHCKYIQLVIVTQGLIVTILKPSGSDNETASIFPPSSSTSIR